MNLILPYMYSYNMEVYPSREMKLILSYIFSYKMEVYPSREHEIHSVIYIPLFGGRLPFRGT